MTQQTSVAMNQGVHDVLVRHLLRDDGQEDICLATYRISQGVGRRTALLGRCILPEHGERRVHGNATVTGAYILRGAELASKEGAGLAILHSHPGGRGWQGISGPDRDAESAYANLARELTGLPLVGLTLAGGDRSWSARHWDVGSGRRVANTACADVRVVGERLAVSWNDALQPPPLMTGSQARTVSAWGREAQADLARRKILVVGAGSVGLDVILRLAASGIQNLTVMDFDLVEERNLDRLIGACRADVALKRTKAFVARREALRAATAAQPTVRISHASVCEPEGFKTCLDYDLIFCCVDRLWPRAVLNALAYDHLIPVIDGGIFIGTHSDGRMRSATWRAHVLRPGRPCVVCSRQVEMGALQTEMSGVADDPVYIANAPTDVGQNVAVLSASVSALMLAQYVSFSVAPSGLGDPGPLQYSLGSHNLEVLDVVSRPGCMYEPAEPRGGDCILCGRHDTAERVRARYDDSLRIRARRWWQGLATAQAG